MSPRPGTVPDPGEQAIGEVRRLMIIGGAEDRRDMMKVLRRFASLAGAEDGHVVVIPTASAFESEAGGTYTTLFERLGAASTVVVAPSSREDAHDARWVEALDRATGVFLTGGNQLKLSQYLVGTPTGEAILRAHARGAVVGGTSAGASILSRHMISLGEEGLTPRQRTAQVSQGLGLVEDVVLDQHFDQRGRYGRLMSVVAVSPALWGLGIDEDTAIELVEGRSATGERIRRFSVHGAGAVFLVDAGRAYTDAHEAADGAPLLLSGAVVHTLPAGAVFDLDAHRLAHFVEQHAQDDMIFTIRQQASDIARLERAMERAATPDEGDTP
ncbi:cyanophycinase [Kytococcus aerolatus]|uniref:Cyanophycinase n=1 Tax=Kytococcus aerolatus TaxID=592308 RepID=A0A212T1I9_9MICO|nr:cyanophycinase [Kytococcus aerolatus]SNC59691.1 cyanophycinase [Kytococcus aerolatus]